MKKLIFIFITLLALTAVFTSTSFASIKSAKDGGQNQAGGCRTQTKSYHYTLSDPKYKGKIVFGSAKVGVCVNEHYSPFYDNYVIQTDAYISETGAFAYCEGRNSRDGAIWINKVGQWSSLDHQVIDCPLRGGFSVYNSGSVVQRVDAKDNSKTVGSRYYGYVRLLLLAPGNAREANDTLATFEFAGPSLIMK